MVKYLRIKSGEANFQLVERFDDVKKAAAKRKFKVYPSAYANMYAAGVCSGRIKPKGTRKKRK